MTKVPQFFTQQAREAAALARQRGTELRDQQAAENPYHIDVFAVRLGTGFSWEVRQFGGFVIAQGSDHGFATADEARSAGLVFLKRMRAAGWTAPR